MVLKAREFISTTFSPVTGARPVSRVMPEADFAAGAPKLVTSGTVRVSVVIPTYNEAANLPHVFDRLPDGLHEVIVVDGRSVDGTVYVARALRPDVKIVLQNRRGKGNAMACGFAAVTGDVVIMLDADGSADPLEIPRFVAALTAGADFAKGTRFAAGGGSSDITPLREWGNRRLNRMANLLFTTSYTDLCYGYNAFWTRCLPALGLSADGPGRCEVVGGRVRDRDDHQHADRQGAPQDRRGTQLRVHSCLRREQPEHLARRVPCVACTRRRARQR